MTGNRAHILGSSWGRPVTATRGAVTRRAWLVTDKRRLPGTGAGFAPPPTTRTDFAPAPTTETGHIRHQNGRKRCKVEMNGRERCKVMAGATQVVIEPLIGTANPRIRPGS